MAVRNWIISRIMGFSPLISSIRLTIASRIPLNKAKKRFFSMIPQKNKSVIPIYQVRTMAIPPPFGVGKSCKLLSFGMTVILFLTAYRNIRNVRINEIIPSKKIMLSVRMIFKFLRIRIKLWLIS